MQTLLQQITAIDGVIGCSLYDEQGKIIAAACPLVLDEAQLGTAAGMMVDCLHALQVSQTLAGMELRFAEGRMLIRPLKGAFINVLCSKTVNLSMVNITLNLALRKLEQMLPQHGAAPAAVPSAAAAPVAASASGLPLRIAHLQKGDVGSSFDQLGMVAVSQVTAKQLSDFFGKISKKIKISTQAGGGGVYPVMVINDVDMLYDGALVIGPGIERKLKVEEGAQVMVELG
jgi:predicted regulator of Ras-like GTPase activity (Roadblock/LC7/MglB family)